MEEIQIPIVVRIYKDAQYGSLVDSMRRVEPPVTVKVVGKAVKRIGKYKVSVILVEYNGERFYVREDDLATEYDQSEVRPSAHGRLTTAC